MSRIFDQKRSKPKIFWHSTEICFVLALFYSLLTELRF